MFINGNNGEWSEFYSLKIFSDKVLSSADENLALIQAGLFWVNCAMIRVLMY